VVVVEARPTVLVPRENVTVEEEEGKGGRREGCPELSTQDFVGL